MAVPYYQDDLVTLHHGDCIAVMRSMPDESVHAIVTDPPYALGFMGRKWDTFGDVGRGAQARVQRASEVTAAGKGYSTSAGPYLAGGVDSLRSAGMPFQVWCQAWATEALRILKPGGHMLSFGGSRTWHRLAVAVEDAGFEIRDSIAWLYGSGFPKSMDVSKAIDKAAGAQRGVVGIQKIRGQSSGRANFGADDRSGGKGMGYRAGDISLTAPATDEAKAWSGWGTALKPAFEPVIVARKPFSGTVASNVLTHGTGAINIDETRIAATGRPARENLGRSDSGTLYGAGLDGSRAVGVTDAGRWPTNVLLDESQAVALDKQTGILTSGLMKARTNREPRKGGTIYGADQRNIVAGDTYADSGGASRFFPTFHYEAKAPGRERPDVDGTEHPTVKPLDLMRWLVRLVASPGAVILEPFAGSGTTLEACLLEGFEVIGIEREADYLPLIMQRIRKPLQQSLFGDDLA